MSIEQVESTSAPQTKPLSLEYLAPGINNLRAGVSREEAERFAHLLEDTGRFGLKIHKPKKGEQNILSWNMLGRKAGFFGTGNYKDVILITDTVLSFRTFQMSGYLQGQVQLGEYLLEIPTDDNPERIVYLHLYSPAA